MALTEKEFAEILKRNSEIDIDGDSIRYPSREESGVARLSEHEMQRRVFELADSEIFSDPRFAMLFAVPNGQYRAGLRPEPGIKRGVPDLFFAVPSGPYHGLFIELKVGRNMPSDAQKDWIARLTARGYYCAIVREDAVAVIEIIKDYLAHADK